MCGSWDALFRRNYDFKSSKFTTLAKLAISRIAILKNKHQVRYSQAKSDVIQLLNLGHHEGALLRVEHVIKHRNMMDVFSMIEDYCHFLIERTMILLKNKECPDELKEAVASLIFTSSRYCGFPELHEIRRIFVSRFGEEFASQAIELHNNCGVNPQIIDKLSEQHASLERKIQVLKDIAALDGIALHLERTPTVMTMDNSNIIQLQKQHLYPRSVEEFEPDASPSDLTKTRNNYRDAADAAQDAYQSALYAMAAARAAFELAKYESQNYDQDFLDDTHQ
ncbi:hypothetical protein K2173_026111 [Erythroxylum novogranatense]|uniref:IST1-like protein n=1 Tax=Erythroxylum novogranatense TaxID=1862640 RepID=A0AAV8SIL5_9ROSI|nr:hypothetical protein K2173_026111 [Erythroxylum novogranatense]